MAEELNARDSGVCGGKEKCWKSKNKLVAAEGSPDNVLLAGETVVEELDWGAFKLGESIVRFLVLQVRKRGELGKSELVG